MICFSGVIKMDLIKIGKFISDLRKEAGFTQEQLGERIGVTNKTISRWETGTYLPPADTLLAMSELFSVSINDILSGKRLSVEEYKQASEENLVQALKSGSFSLMERMAFYKKKWLKDHIALLTVMGLIVLGVFVTGFVLRNEIITACSMLLLIVAHCIGHNSMMAYAEHKVFDKSTNQ